MVFTRLYLSSFRNYEEQVVDLNEGLTLIHGENGQGKTNLLEALFLCHQGFSFRTRKLSEMIAWGQKEFLLRSEARNEFGDHKIGMRYSQKGLKEVSINGDRSEKLSSLMGFWPVVAMGPGDIELCQGAPGSRRRFLDANLCQIDPEYLQTLRKFQVQVKQRNHLLKKGQYSILDVYTQEVARLGLILVKKRSQWEESLRPRLQHFYRAISQGREQVDFKYKSSFLKALDCANPQEEVFKMFAEKKQVEEILKSTHYGPHKDDLNLVIQEHPLREYGSQGQQRSFSLAMQLATADWLRDWKGRDPLVLLDDVFAELDPLRRGALLEFALSFRQVFLTAPVAKKELFQADHLLKITQGKVTF